MDVPFEAVERLEEPRTTKLARIGFATGIASVLLLGAAIAFAHHWNPLSMTIVGAWALATLGGIVLSPLGLRDATRSRRLAKWGVALASISVGALAVAGLAFASGLDPAGACGGG